MLSARNQNLLISAYGVFDYFFFSDIYTYSNSLLWEEISETVGTCIAKTFFQKYIPTAKNISFTLAYGTVFVFFSSFILILSVELRNGSLLRLETSGTSLNVERREKYESHTTTDIALKEKKRESVIRTVPKTDYSEVSLVAAA